jgi:hypothetical protein
MGKYGSGVSMKSMLETEMKEIQAVLQKYDMSDEDKKIIINAYKEVAYQWCSSNANACACEKQITAAIGLEKQMKYINISSPEFNNAVYIKMKETYPWFDDEDDD